MLQHSEEAVRIPVDGVELEGTFDLPQDAPGVVVFAHGSGSSRKSPRNNYVAEVIRERGLGTLLFDLLTEAEDQNRQNRFDISLLTDRLVSVTQWVWAQDPELAVGYFGSSTGAGAALRAAARYDDVGAVVSRGGRVDMAVDSLGDVEASTLFIVGGADTEVLQRNRQAYERLDCERALHVVAGAGHLFEEADELAQLPRSRLTGSKHGCGDLLGVSIPPPHTDHRSEDAGDQVGKLWDPPGHVLLEIPDGKAQQDRATDGAATGNGTGPPVGSERLSQCYREGAVTEKVEPLVRAVGVEGFVTVERCGDQRPDKQDDPDGQGPSPARARYRLLR